MLTANLALPPPSRLARKRATSYLAGGWTSILSVFDSTSRCLCLVHLAHLLHAVAKDLCHLVSGLVHASVPTFLDVLVHRYVSE